MRLYQIQIGNPDNPRSNKCLQIYLFNHRFELELTAYTQKTLKGAYRRFLRAFQQSVADNVIPANIAKEALEWIAPYPDGELVEFLPKNSDERRKLEQSGETLFIGDVIDPVRGHLASFDFDDNTDCDNGLFIWFILTLDPDKPETFYMESPDSVVFKQNQGIREGKLNNVVQFKPSTLQAMLALPAGDEQAFIEAQEQAGNPVENQSARQVQESVKKWKKDKTQKSSPWSSTK